MNSKAIHQDSCLLRTDNQGATILTLNRPDKFNPLSEEMLTTLQNELDIIGSDPTVRVVVLAARGKAFCAGHDLKEMGCHTDKAYFDALFKQCGHLMMTINRISQPVIAQVQGIATAAGCQLVAACDLAVAVETAKFATSGIRYGLFCSTPAVSVSRKISRKHAMELLLTGEFISAEMAEKQGLVNRVVPEAELEKCVQELTSAIISKSAVAVSMGKEMFYKQIEMSMEDAYVYGAEVMARNMMVEDAQEGFKAFLEKRQPVWNHGFK